MENDINREVSIEQVDYNIDIEQANYSIEITPLPKFELQLNEQGPQGARGYTGNGIESFEKTSTSGLIDTYTITFTDGETFNLNVTNGRSIVDIELTSTVGLVDTYTISYNDSTTSTFTITNGEDGINPTVTVGTTTTGNPGTNASVVNSGTAQDVVLDFTIPRGDKGETGQDGAAATITVGSVTTGLPTDPASVTNVGTSSAAVFDFTIPKGDTGNTGATGNGIASITKTGTVGLVDTYTILYTNGNSTTFTVTNGQNGSGSVADVLVNGTSVLDGQDAKILIKTINSNSITGSGNLDVGTVTSVNNVAPISGDVTLTASDIDALADSTKYGADLSYSSNTLQLLDQDGNSLGNSVAVDTLPTQTGQSGKFLTTDGTDASWGNLPVATASTVGVVKPDNASIRVESDGTISAICRNVGEIITSTLPLTDAGLHLLDGSLILGGGIYQGFVDYIASIVSIYPSIFTTESAWQTSVTTYGVCGKFVYDSINNTIRLPKITGIIEGTTDVTALGDLIQAGLPVLTTSTTGAHTHTRGSMNITGSARIAGANIESPSGAFSASSASVAYTGNYGSTGILNFNAANNWTGSTSSEGNHSHTASWGANTNTVQPQTIKCYYYIVIATTTKTEIEVDIDEIATDLNGKADRDLSNLSIGLTNTICTTKATTTSSASSAKPAVIKENYVNGTSWYRLWSDNWCEQGGRVSTGGSVTYLKAFADTNYTLVASGSTTSSNSTQYRQIMPNAYTATGFTGTTSSGVGLLWYACGYIA